VRTKWRGAAAVLALCVIGGCGSVPPTSEPSPDTEASPTTDVSATDESIACPRFRTPTTLQTQAEIAAASQVAERNLGAINAYLGAHQSEGGTPWLDSVNEPPRVIIGFTSNVAEHRLALAPLLTDPDQVLVCQVAHSASEIAAVAAEIQQTQTSSDAGFFSVGAGVEAVDIQLRADQEPTAAGLVTKYGDLVSITLGNFAYPPPTDGTPAAVSVCAADVTGPTDLNGLHAELTLSAPTVPSGNDTTGTVTVTNTGSAPASFESGEPLVGSIVQAGTSKVVANYTSGIAGVGLGPTLQPGESTEIGVVVGTASCDPSVGYTLPPGQYEVIVPVVVKYPQTAGETTVNQLVTTLATLTVVP
jgi:hypothetical protein